MDKFPITTFGLPLKGLSFSRCEDIDALRHSLERAGNKLFIVGGGSNLLPIAYLDAHIIQVDFKSIEYEVNANEVFVTVGAGAVWHDLVLDSLHRGYTGLENLSLIPGSVGAAPIQNIGAYGVELSERVVEVECLDLHSQEIFVLSNEECDFAYRDSIFKQEMKGRVVITAVTLQLDLEPRLNLSYGVLADVVAEITNKPSAKDVSDAVIKIRQSKLPDPKMIGNAGSFFKNPVVSKEKHLALKEKFPNLVAYQNNDDMKLAAGWLIDQAGLKGYQHADSDAGVHDKQALVIVNRAQASGEELLATAVHVQRTVYAKYDILLEPEVQIVGDKDKIRYSGILFRPNETI